MEVIALVVGVLIGIFVGIVIHSKRLSKGFAGTLVIVRRDPTTSPEMYLEQVEDPSLIEKMDCVVMSVRALNLSTQK